MFPQTRAEDWESWGLAFVSVDNLILFWQWSILWVGIFIGSVKNLLQAQEIEAPVLVGSSWRREWQPTPEVFCMEESHGQRDLFDYNPWDTESDTIE